MKLSLLPKIDLLVADHILGYELVRLGYLKSYLENPTIKQIKELNEAAKRHPVAVPRDAWDDPPSEGASIFKIADRTIALAPQFTLDLALTFNAVCPQIYREGHLFALKQRIIPPHIVWEASFDTHVFMSRIPPLAICIAALKAAEVDLSGIDLNELQ